MLSGIRQYQRQRRNNSGIAVQAPKICQTAAHLPLVWIEDRRAGVVLSIFRLNRHGGPCGNLPSVGLPQQVGQLTAVPSEEIDDPWMVEPELHRFVEEEKCLIRKRGCG